MAVQGKVGQSLGECTRSGVPLGEGVQSDTMIDEAALRRDKDISVRRSSKVQLQR